MNLFLCLSIQIGSVIPNDLCFASLLHRSFDVVETGIEPDGRAAAERDQQNQQPSKFYWPSHEPAPILCRNKKLPLILHGFSFSILTMLFVCASMVKRILSPAFSPSRREAESIL